MKKLFAVGLAAAAVVSGTAWLSFDSTYRVHVLLGSAANVVEGGSVLVSGVEEGEVTQIGVQDGKATLELELDRDVAPLHDGAKVTVDWKALLGERRISIADGPASNATIPDGGMVRGVQQKPMELDEIINALDKPTRRHLTSFFGRLDQTLHGSQPDVRSTLRTIGPALNSLGELLRAAGTDGPAIENLVRRLNDMMSTLAQRGDAVRAVIEDLSDLTRQTVGQRRQLSVALRALPPTLDQATTTLASVPGTVDDVSPLLRDLRPATRRLPRVATNLRPVLTDLRPMVGELKPTLAALHTLLGTTPGLLDRSHAVLPAADHALTYAQPALRFLRPYTPELAGWLTTWGSAGGNYDSNGHYWRMHVQGGATSLNANPGVLPPGVRKDPYPPPGSNADQPWTDAFGDTER